MSSPDSKHQSNSLQTWTTLAIISFRSQGPSLFLSGVFSMRCTTFPKMVIWGKSTFICGRVRIRLQFIDLLGLIVSSCIFHVLSVTVIDSNSNDGTWRPWKILCHSGILMKTCVVYFAQNDTKRSRSRAAAWGDLPCRALPNFRRLRWHWHTPESDLLLTWGEIHLGKPMKTPNTSTLLTCQPQNYLKFWQFSWFHPYFWLELLWVGQQSPLLIQVAIGKSCWTCKILLKFFQRISILLVGEKDSNSKPYNPVLVELQHLKVVKNSLKFALPYEFQRVGLF